MDTEFDFLCRWCGREVVMIVDNLSDTDPLMRTVKWLHRQGGFTCLDATGHAISPAREAMPTRWTVAG